MIYLRKRTLLKQTSSPAPLITKTKSGELPTFNKPKPLPRPKQQQNITAQEETTIKRAIQINKQPLK